uniref:protein-tyrosine-phosphatase n=1 Tax=Malurus cyaneus samueli TaxID=2593467 RepID=A0A8C5T2T6_9PASS
MGYRLVLCSQSSLSWAVQHSKSSLPWQSDPSPWFWCLAENLRLAAGSGPTLPCLSCSAGIGRTGCFIATRIGCQQLRDKGEVDILGIVCRLRIDRGGMIQTSEQYQFLHHTLALYASQRSAGTTALK